MAEIKLFNVVATESTPIGLVSSELFIAAKSIQSAATIFEAKYPDRKIDSVRLVDKELVIECVS